MELSEVQKLLAVLTPKKVAALREVVGQTEPQPTPIKENPKMLTSKELIDTIHETIKQLDGAASIIGDTKGDQLRIWLEALQSDADDHRRELDKCKSQLSDEFNKSLDTIERIQQLVRNYSADQEVALDAELQKLMCERKPLEQRATAEKTMTQWNKEVEETMERLLPTLKRCITTLCKKLDTFYTQLDLVSDGYDNDSFLETLPSRDQVKLFLSMESIDDVKTLMDDPKFSKVGPSLVKKLGSEIDSLKRLAVERALQIRDLQSQLHTLVSSLGETTDLDLKVYTDNAELAKTLGLKLSTVEKYSQKVDALQALKTERQQKLDSYMSQVGELWSVLREEDNSIQQFLKSNKNLRSGSLQKFESLIEELQNEKAANMAKFIEWSRTRVREYWDLLMYDEQERQQFSEFYVDDTAEFNDRLLDSHKEYIESLRLEAENLKPLLESISKLNDLLDEKKRLDESSKNSERLFQRDFFKVLRREEITRDRLQKALPATINMIKVKLIEYENQGQRVLKIDGQPYINKIQEIEVSLQPRGHASKPRSPVRKRAVSTGSRSLPPMRHARSASTPTSAIRYRSTNDMANPFLSRQASPVKKSRLNNGRPMDRSRNSHRSPRVSSAPSSTHTHRALSTSVSNTPIVIKGGSPMRRSRQHLDYSTASKTSALPAPKFRYPTTTMLSKTPAIPAPSRKRKASSIPVEELSDSLIYFSDNEADDKENQAPQRKLSLASRDHSSGSILPSIAHTDAQS